MDAKLLQLGQMSARAARHTLHRTITGLAPTPIKAVATRDPYRTADRARIQRPRSTQAYLDKVY